MITTRTLRRAKIEAGENRAVTCASGAIGHRDRSPVDRAERRRDAPELLHALRLAAEAGRAAIVGADVLVRLADGALPR